MARLRIRIELNRGGVGVPLHKLASVVDEAQKFFYLLTEDIHVDQSKGEWLGFDFGNESLNFTAEFVGPVTAEQVSAFHAAFDGTTSLRRTTIAQFARITEAIEQDELIGFGLYLSDDNNEPTEWRCLSRRDALRISEEIQLLIDASGEVERESHLPAVTNSGAGARLFSDRRERGLESAKWTAYVREVEANMDRRISRVEHVLEGQSGLIEDLHTKSSSTEDSVRKLLTAVEGFCAQTTRQLEAISLPPGVLPVAQASVPNIAPVAEIAQAAAATASVSPSTAEPAPATTPKTIPEPVKAKTPPPPEPAPRVRPGLPLPAELDVPRKPDWRLVGGFALLGIGVIIIGTWAWQNLFSGPAVQRVAATSAPAAQPSPAPKPVTVAPPPQPPAAGAPAKAHVDIQASELTWVSLRDAGGNAMLSRLFAAGDTQSLNLPNGATLRIGNAGGLKIVLNGNSIGAIGPHGKVREVTFRNGSYKIVEAD